MTQGCDINRAGMTPSGPEKSHSDGVHQFGGHRFHPPDFCMVSLAPVLAGV